MGLADLISRLEEEAQGRLHAIETEADAEVRAIEEATERAVAEITARQLEHDRAERETVRQRQLAIARREARARELEARHAQIDRILNRAQALIPDVAASTSYLDVLPAHVDEALSFLVGLRPRVRCQAAFVPIVQSAVDRHEGVQLMIDEAVGPGVIVEAGDGSAVVDNTLAARLARAKTRLIMELSRKW